MKKSNTRLKMTELLFVSKKINKKTSKLPKKVINNFFIELNIQKKTSKLRSTHVDPRPRTGEAGVAVGKTSTAWLIMPSPRPLPSWLPWKFGMGHC